MGDFVAQSSNLEAGVESNPGLDVIEPLAPHPGGHQHDASHGEPAENGDDSENLAHEHGVARGPTRSRIGSALASRSGTVGPAPSLRLAPWTLAADLGRPHSRTSLDE